MARVVSQIVFLLLMAVILPASLAVIVCLYLPFVGLKALWMMATGRAKPVFLQSPEERARNEAQRAAASGPLPF